MTKETTESREGRETPVVGEPSQEPGRSNVPSTPRADERKARAAEKLKENLRRRKQQLRARRAGAADETEGLPAAKSTNDDV
ncbi:hypothetical protein [Ciceribacter thiooxidans]|uniref:Uncharacterized protein n=1 Tax=Ciceribacter thiooxidans TaxID=1969821 RepID=A0ABV7I0A4_9HYPH|nr:hypothetical protein [Ciceribacter thiooxidans]